MAKCPKCGTALIRKDETAYECPNCKKRYKVKQSSPAGYSDTGKDALSASSEQKLQSPHTPMDSQGKAQTGFSPEPGRPRQTSSPENKTEQSSIFGKNKGLIIAVIAAVAFMFMLAVTAVAWYFLIWSRPTIDLNKYLYIETSGCDGYGTVEGRLDTEAIAQKYGKRIKFNRKNKDLMEFHNIVNGPGFKDFMQNPETWAILIDQNISVSFEPAEGLSNGDVIQYTWNIDPELENDLLCKWKRQDGEYEVTGLIEAQPFDAFADVEVEFSGTDGSGTATLNYTGNDFNTYDFSIDGTSGLSNGDKVTVTFLRNAQTMAETEGRVPEETVKEYTVSGLGSYVKNHDQISEDALSKMQAQAEDVYNAYVAKNWDEDSEELQSFDYLGTYVLSAKDPGSILWGTRNSVYLVYKAGIRNTVRDQESGEDVYDETSDVYWYIDFDNVLTGESGGLDMDISEYRTPSHEVNIDSGLTEGRVHSWFYHGYSSLDELYKDVVTANLDQYNHDDNVTDTF